MFGKIHTDIFNSSLIAEGGWLPTYVFMCMVTLSDKDGNLPIDPRVLYRQIGFDIGEQVSLEAFLKAIEFLSFEDRNSNLPAQSGRRIIPLSELDDVEGNRGFRVVNKAHYRDKGGIEQRRENDAERKRRERKKKKDKAEQAAHQDAKPDELKRGDPPKPEPEPKPRRKPKRFAEFWEAYPKKRNEDGCKEIWLSNDLDEIADKIISAVNTSRENDSEWKRDEGRWIPSSERYLNERRWGDVTEVPRARDPLARMLLQCCFDPVSWLAPEVLAKVSDAERAEYEYIKARNLKNGHKEPDWDSPEQQAFSKKLIEKLDRKSAEVSTADYQGKSLSEIFGFKPKETS